MGTLFLNSTSIAPSKVVQVSQTHGQIFLLMRKNKSSVCCQGSGNAIRSSGFSSILTASTDLVDKGSLVLSPNGKNQIDSNTNNANNTIGVKDLVPFGGSQSTSTSSLENDDGIGILKFLRGKSFLITGGTGFLAKILIEKILRTMPDVGKIYLLIKAKDKEAAMARLKNEIINAELFTRLRQSYGKSYQGFMLSKLVPVIGNVSESDLGLDDSDSAKTMVKEVDVIVNSAANTTFDERYDVSLGINTKGPCHLMNFAKKCDKLKLFLQVSTAYVNGQRQGRVLEKAFRVGECIACESSIPGAPRGLIPKLDIENEMRLGFDSMEETLENNQKWKDLGLERAKKYGWQDTYVFTKAMGEMMLDNMREDVPVVIIRPSVIESTLKDPFPGWIEGNRMLDPIIVYYGKGQLTGFPVDRNGVLDVVPADMVVNATLAAMAKHGQDQKPGINVYQIASSVVNPLVFQDLMRLLYEYYKSSPYLDSNGRPIPVDSMKLFPSMEDFSQHLWRDTTQRSELLALASSNDKSSQKLEILCRKWVEQATYLANIYEPYTFYGGRFDNSNTQRLMESMSEEEKRKFGFDVESIDWTDYITNVHIPGLRKHVMKGRGTPT